MLTWTRRWPRIAISIAAVLLLTTLLSAGRIVHAVRAHPNPTTDSIAVANAIAAAEAPPGANAWETVRSIIVDDLGVSSSAPTTTDWLIRFQAARRHNEYAWLETGAWDVVDRSEVVALLDDIRPLLAPLARTLDEPAYVIPIVHAGDGLTGELDPNARRSLTNAWVNQSEITWLRSFPEVLRRIMRIDAQRGDWDSFLNNASIVIRLGEGAMRTPHVRNQLVGSGNISVISREIAQTLNDYDPPRDVLVALLQTIDGAIASFADAETILIRTELFELRDLVQWTFSDDAAGDGRFIPAELHRQSGAIGTAGGRTAEVILNLLGGAVSRRQTLADIDEAERRMNSLVGAKPADLIPGADRFERWWRARSGFTAEAPLATGILPRLASTRTYLTGVRLMILLELSRADTGETPADLISAVAHADTIDPVSGEPYQYIPTSDDPHGRRYILRMPWAIPDDWRGDEINPPRSRHWSQRGPDDWHD